MNQNENVPSEARGISRRAVTTGMVWSVPVVALAVATPMAAASQAVVFEAPDDYTDVSVGDSLPLYFGIEDGGFPAVGGVLSVVLADTSTVQFDPEADGYAGPTAFNAAVEDGFAVAVAIVNAGGVISGTITYGTTTASFSVNVSLAA
ncbi:hypothetical protein N1031_16925 [Herbiconiux moechotypicola]|uniref:DUF4402 domain-containing protein n=1 Tax=Herbiconiux moechotypicola TaxID=637393 RepID=A0ABP5QPI7_9MICO|nr:hypothetical protein [Herbiconiux moechotypicola]MCS5731448.1 hypothetical protein [Herbiconiux moechotypicola]